MAARLNDLGWFSRSKVEQQFGAPNESSISTLLYFVLTASTILGFIFICARLFDFFRLIFSLFVLQGKPLRTFGAPSKTWAIITGASDGIGREFALHLARSGYSTLLVSRTVSKLDAVAADIKAKYNTPVKTLAMDFSANKDSDYNALQAAVDGLDVSILINNVGQSHSIPVPFIQTPKEEIDGIIEINCHATLRVTQIVARGMVQRKRGLILTMGSFGGLLPTPLLATYSGSKAFLQQWSTALGSELAPKGVTVELVQSYLVTSNMSKIRKSSALVPTPRQFVKATLSRVGRSGGAQGWAFTSTPYWAHAVVQFAIVQAVAIGNPALLWWNRGMHEDIRKRALRKMERLGKGR